MEINDNRSSRKCVWSVPGNVWYRQATGTQAEPSVNCLIQIFSPHQKFKTLRG